MQQQFENDLESLFAGDFNDGPLTFAGSSTGCIMRQRDMPVGSLGHEDLVDRTIECCYATAALPTPPIIGSQVTVAGVGYAVREKLDKDGGISCIYLVAYP